MEALTVVGNNKELQIWVALVQKNFYMRKIEPWNFLSLCEYV